MGRLQLIGESLLLFCSPGCSSVAVSDICERVMITSVKCIHGTVWLSSAVEPRNSRRGVPAGADMISIAGLEDGRNSSTATPVASACPRTDHTNVSPTLPTTTAQSAWKTSTPAETVPTSRPAPTSSTRPATPPC